MKNSVGDSASSLYEKKISPIQSQRRAPPVPGTGVGGSPNYQAPVKAVFFSWRCTGCPRPFYQRTFCLPF